jgi:endonuclease YncB( thermonuclease family)
MSARAGTFARWSRFASLSGLATRLVAVWKLVRHPAAPWPLKAIAFATIAYAVSPIDLVPDFIPVLGLVDDLVLIPLAVALVARLAPPPLWQTCLVQAQATSQRLPRLLWGAAAVVLVWFALAAVALGVLLWPAPAAAQAPVPAAEAPTRGTVQRVIDGDSLWFIDTAGRRFAVRLVGIDAPELCQAAGPEARRALEDHVTGKAVSLRTAGRDEYGRTLATVHVAGFNLNQRLVEEGWAWSTRTKWDRGPYVRAERMSAALNRGLHAGSTKVAPWDFRRAQGRCPVPGDTGPEIPGRPMDAGAVPR